MYLHRNNQVREVYWALGPEWTSQPVELEEGANEIVLASYLLDFVSFELGRFVS